MPHRTEVILGGMISAIKVSHVRKLRPGAAATKFANFDLEDMHGTIRCILWPEEFLKFGELVKPDAILLVRGAVDRRGGDEANLVVNELIPMEQLDARYTSGVVIRIDQHIHGTGVLPKVREIVRGYPGNRDLELVLALEDGSRVHLKSHRLQLEINPELRRRIDDLLGPGHYQLIMSPPKPSNGNGNGNRRPSPAAPCRVPDDPVMPASALPSLSDGGMTATLPRSLSAACCPPGPARPVMTPQLLFRET